MTSRAPGSIRKVLAVIDSDDAQTALRSAAAFADRHGAALEVITCLEPPHDLALLARVSGENPEQLTAEAAERLRADAQDQIAKGLPGREIIPQVVIGKAFLEIIRYVAANGCDFVVKRAEPLTGVSRFLFASTDQHLMRKCPCPVWLQTADAPTVPKRILATVDLDISDAAEPTTLTGLNQRVLEAASGMASAQDTEVIVLHAWEAIGEGMVWAYSGGRDGRTSSDRYVNEILATRQDAMRRLLQSLPARGGPVLRLTPALVRGAPESVIEDQRRQHKADLVVMGTVARTGLSGVFIGNTAENIINTLECPVLAVKPEGFVSPLLAEPH